jgi:RNA-binding protein NOB1
MKFAKKTGDYGSLSAVDVKVMALTYQFTCEREPERTAKFRVQPLRDVSWLVSLCGVTLELQ